MRKRGLANKKTKQKQWTAVAYWRRTAVDGGGKLRGGEKIGNWRKREMRKKKRGCGI